jgi:ABC-2 type transport system ATP-binding protein
VIRIAGLVVQFGPIRAVDGLELTVPRGRLFGLLGPNGAGKTTTIACIGGLVRPDGGTVEVAGTDVARDPIGVRRQLGIVPQRLALYPTLSVGQNLRIAGGLYGLSGARLADRVRWGLALARLDGRESSAAGVLSGGMQRRLNLACALLHDPPIVLCDEPTTGVDPQSRNHLFESIRALHAEGRTIVYTTHYLEEVEALCEEVAIVDHGRLLTCGPLAELVAAPQSTRFEVALRDPAQAEALAAALGAAGLPVAEVTARKRSLEEVFLEKTGRGLRDAS